MTNYKAMEQCDHNDICDRGKAPESLAHCDLFKLDSKCKCYYKMYDDYNTNLIKTVKKYKRKGYDFTRVVIKEVENADG